MALTRSYVRLTPAVVNTSLTDHNRILQAQGHVTVLNVILKNELVLKSKYYLLESLAAQTNYKGSYTACSMLRNTVC